MTRRIQVSHLVWAALTSLALAGCGGGGGNGSNNSAPAQDVKVTSSYQTGVKPLDSGAGIVEVEADIFTAPKSLGLGVGSVFILDKVAYKVTAVSDESAERSRLFTSAPTLDETFSELEIVGTVPLSGGTIESASSANGISKSRSGKMVAGAGVRQLAATVDSPDCSIPADGQWVTNIDPAGETNTLSSITTGGIECKVGGSVTVSGKLNFAGLVTVDYKKGRSAALNKFNITARVSPTVTFAFEKEFGKDWRKNVATLHIPVAVTAGTVQITVPIDFIAGASATVKGQSTISAMGQVEANFTAEPKASATVYGKANSDLSGSVDLSGYVGLSPGVGVSIFNIDIASFHVDGKIIAEINGEANSQQACANLALKVGAGLSFKKAWSGDAISLGEAEPSTLWKNGNNPQCLSYPKVIIQANGNPVTGQGSTSVPYTPYGGAFNLGASKSLANRSGVARGTAGDDDVVSTSASLSVAGSLLYGTNIAAVKWDVVGGDMPLTFSSATAATTAMGATSAVGTTAQVKVSLTSSSGQTATETFTVVRNKLPVAVGKITASGSLLSLDASQSYDPNGQTIRSYRWILPDGSVINTKSPIVSVNASGLSQPFTAKLLVWSSGSFKERSEITPVAYSTGSDTVAIIEQGSYRASNVLVDCSNNKCTPSYWKNQGSGGKMIDGNNRYDLSGSSWVKHTNINSDDWVLTSTGWQPEDCAAGQSITYSADSAGVVTVKLCNGTTKRVSARTVDAGGKTLKALGLKTPVDFDSTTMPSGSMLYWLKFQSLQDTYYLYTGYKVSNWVWDPVTNTNNEVPLTSLNDFINAYATPVAPAIAYTGWSGLCFSFDTGGTSAGGNLTLWSCDNTGQGNSSRIGSSTYERRVVYGKELLIIKAQAPENAVDTLVMYAVKDGYLYGGWHQAQANASAEEANFNKVMMNAILQAGGKPGVVD